MIRKIFDFNKLKDVLLRFGSHSKMFYESELEASKLHGALDSNVEELYSEVHRNSEPVFVLSTGRAGTKLLSNLIEEDGSYTVSHQPLPELTYHAGYAYAHQKEQGEALMLVADACRYEVIRNCYLLGKRYVETNNRITFFAPQLAKLYPRAKFIHLVRDVNKFVESGVSRGWYSYSKLFDEGKITPQTSKVVNWGESSDVQKVTWLWWETNRFIRKFFEELSPERKLTVLSEDLYHQVDKVNEVLGFIGAKPLKTKRIESHLKVPTNSQRKSERKNLSDADLKEIEQLLSKLRSFPSI